MVEETYNDPNDKGESSFNDEEPEPAWLATHSTHLEYTCCNEAGEGVRNLGKTH